MYKENKRPPKFVRKKVGKNFENKCSKELLKLNVGNNTFGCLCFIKMDIIRCLCLTKMGIV